MKKFWKITISISVSVGLLLLAFGIYVGNYYKADTKAIQTFSSNDVSAWDGTEGILTFGSPNAKTGFVFYPGGKVEYTAYIPLMEACSQNGVFCVLLKMPFNLAVLNIGAAQGIQERYPMVENWYIGGHSLGGSMAATYLEENYNDFKGLVLLGSYSTANIANKNLRVLSVYGSEDTVLNKENYQANCVNLPSNYKEVIIQGGCHSYFGMYGTQKGDGIPTITNIEQIQFTAQAIGEFINEES